MKIINIVPGFGGTFYCGNCLRDSAFTRTLKTTGHEAITLPLYMPLMKRYNNGTESTPVFYGAVNIYFEQKFRFLRKMPKWLHKFLNSPSILEYAAKKSGSTRARGMEAMTISMLKGEDGFQKDELDLLITYLKEHEKPDVIHLSNALLIGLAGQIRKELGIPVVCSLQDEDVWINPMQEPYRTQLWDLMSEKAKDVDAFVAVSHFFARVMKEKMNIPDEKLHTVHIGVDPKIYKHHLPNPEKPVIGFLSRSNKANGFETVVDAFIKLKEEHLFRNAKLKVSGGYTGDDKRFINKQIKKLNNAGYLNDLILVEDFRTEKLSEFFSDVSVLSVPVINGEAFGLYQLEALACGVPIIQPNVGAFPEIIEASGGGALFEPNNSDALAEKLSEILSDSQRLQQLSVTGRNSVIKRFNTQISTQNMVNIYKEVSSRTVNISDK
ncbi:MAG: glycosyltransferase family 4 protein [Bacteroidales bacterium]|nr:glycosyltransferase family 4 protein [Bacteroidales bacterium]